MSVNVQSQLLGEARSLADAGQTDAARRAYHKVLADAPDDPALLQEVGFVEVEAGQLEAGLEFMKKAAAIEADDPNVHMNLGEVYRLIGDRAAAIRHFGRTVELDPEDGDAHHALADMLVANRSIARAFIHISAAREISPDDPEVLNLFGVIAELRGDVKIARQAFAEALNFMPDFPDALSNLGALHVQNHQAEEAIACYTKAWKLRPLSEQQLFNLFGCYQKLGRADLALKVAKELILITGNQAHALVLRGSAYLGLGNFEAAERDYRAALRADRGVPLAYESLGAIHKLQDSDLEYMSKRLERPSFNDQDLIGYSYALFQGYHDRGDYEQAFEYLLKANELLLAKSTFDPASLVHHTNEMKSIYTNGFFQQVAGAGFEKSGPIFIVGMPRSGTTLTERILAAHSRVHGGGERLDVLKLEEEIEDYPICLADQPASWFADRGRQLYESMFRWADGLDFVTDKLPENLNSIGFISAILPNAKIIYCKRHPMDNCLSCFEQHFADGLEYTLSLESLAIAYKQHDDLVRHWFDVSPIPIHTVDYEELVSEPEGVIRGLLDYVGLDWEPQCLNPEQTSGSIATASIWQARQPINKKSVNRWRRYEKQLQPLLEALQPVLE